MRMMKNNNNEIVMVIGIDHGYGNMKTATRCFPSGVARYDKEPIFQNNLLVYNGMYYQIGEEHKEFCAEKTQDEDYVVVTAIIVEAIKRYKKMWDEISQMFLIGSLSGITVLGDVTRKYLPVNLILLFILINMGIMLLRIYLRKKFDYM